MAQMEHEDELLHYSSLLRRRPADKRGEPESPSTVLDLDLDLLSSSDDDRRAQWHANIADFGQERNVRSNPYSPLPATRLTPPARPVSAVNNMTNHTTSETEADNDAATRFEHVIDTWSVKLKRDLLAQLAHLRGDMLSHSRDMVDGERVAHSREIRRLRQELHQLTELVRTYEHSLQSKDHSIAELRAELEQRQLHAQQHEQDLQVRAQELADRHTHISAVLADKYRHTVLMRKTFRALHTAVESKWRQRVQRACQTRAEQVWALFVGRPSRSTA